jgi:hypothetical protein
MKCVVFCAASPRWRSTSAMPGCRAAHALSPAQVQQARSDRYAEHSLGDFDHAGFAASSQGLASDVEGVIAAATMAPAPAVAAVLTVAGEMPDRALFRPHFSL